MKLSHFKESLNQLEKIAFKLPNGTLVPCHFHVTEVGKVNKHFIDCGGTVRTEEVISLQLWEANDYDHRLHPEKLLSIIKLSEEHLGLKDSEVEVEYQGETICKYNISFDGVNFNLLSKFTDCLAKDNCGIPQEELPKKETSCCDPSSGCC